MAGVWRVVTDPGSPEIRHYFPTSTGPDQVRLEQELVGVIARFLVQTWIEQQEQSSEVMVAHE
ncbi:MAG: hypothetical protein M0Z36_08240 [Thermaerobacter sp.]|nr:hypothetical protein [Thermaerobacter sp.]